MMLPLLLLHFLLPLVHSFADFCYGDSQCDPYSWGEVYPSCHPLLEAHHSPIALGGSGVRRLALDALQLRGFNSTARGRWTLVNHGHSVVLEVGGGLHVSGGGLPASYRTVQLHFHWGSSSSNGSEHTVLQRRFPMEMHIVSIKSSHTNLSAALDDPSGVAGIAVFIDLAYEDNQHFSPISEALHLVSYRGQQTSIRPFPLITLLPHNNLTQFYRYHGSLTTPPCSPAVVWTVYQVPIFISVAQESDDLGKNPFPILVVEARMLRNLFPEGRRLEPFISRIYSTRQDDRHQLLLQDNFRHIHPSYSTVYGSEDLHLPSSSSSSSSPPALILLLLLSTLTPVLAPLP